MKIHISDKLYKINLAGQIYKIMDTDADIVEFYVDQIKAGIKTIDDVPNDLKSSVEKLIK
jgi:hypothetical protein